MNKTQKLKVGDKVYCTVGNSYSWRDNGVIIKIKRKKRISLYRFADVALVKNKIGQTIERILCNLEKR
jgi:hypothetical protein